MTRLSLQDVIREFKKLKGNERFSVFKEEIQSALVTDQKSDI